MDSQNENETSNSPEIDESMIADNTQSSQSSQSNNIEIEGI